MMVIDKEASQAVTTTSQSLLNVVTSTNVATQQIITSTTYGLQNSLARRAALH